LIPVSPSNSALILKFEISSSPLKETIDVQLSNYFSSSPKSGSSSGPIESSPLINGLSN